ncbi:pleckstrin homology domain-containing family A member 4 isoform X6 [Oncorhynchus kisutch]|uniref:pleckstrin homology domain-containing family A member 4 isoform X6 n=1 Tax=Oncorhynchus kisutch TaxID=8019 RepID=UPI0009A01C45|nr:pleckstrin homology domain-containing family A member 4 isoform X6 [Oncorhynchus kisutch]
MEVETASRQTRLVRMEDQDRMSHASSVVTISSFPVRSQDGDDRVQTFGKRCRAAKRDPNCPVVIRGWLNKKDSSGLKLWKRRWFVLSNYCLFYYKDSREESVLGSIPLPSYNILFCTPRECKNRKNTFKVVHQGMRSYFFSADTQEDMLGWVRALSQSACMEADSSINRRCSSYQDFTQIGGSSESVDLPHSPSLSGPRNAAHTNTSQRNQSQVARGGMGAPHSEPRGRRSVRRSPSPRTPSPTEFSSRRRNRTDEDSLPFHSGPNTPPKPTEFMGTGSLTPRGQLGSRPHTPVGRVDIRPQEDPPMTPQTLCYTPASPKMEFKSAPHTPGTDRWHTINRPTPVYSSLHHTPSGRRAFGKSSKSELFKEKETPPPVRPLESETDAVLTRLCGCDKLLQSLSLELAHLQVDKDSVQCALEMTRLQLDEWRNQGLRGQEGALTQKALLQEELVTIRARMCDVSLEMDRVWSQYERMESELSVFRSHLQHVCNFGMPQEQSQAQRELWMMDDILSGLRVNRDNFRVLLGFQRHTVPIGVFQKSSSHPGTPGSPTERSGLPTGVESEPPARPPLPQELQDTNQGRDQGHVWMNPNYEGIYSGPGDPLDRRGNSQSDLHGDRTQRETSESQSSSRWSTPDITNKKGRMSEEEQIERMRRHQERVASRRKPPMSGPTSQTQYQSSEPKEEAPFPLRVTRVLTAVLPSSLVARRVSVEDPPPELATPLPEQIPPGRLTEQSKQIPQKAPRRQLFEMPDKNSNWSQAEMREMSQEQPPAKRLARALQELASARQEQNSYGLNATRAQQSHNVTTRSSREDPWKEASNTESAMEALRPQQGQDWAVVGNGGVASNGGGASDPRVEGHATLITSAPDPDLTPEQREAKLRRVERIRERVIRSAVRESAVVPGHPLTRMERQELHNTPSTQKTYDKARKSREMPVSGPYEDVCGGWCHSDGRALHSNRTVEPPTPGEKPLYEDEGKGHIKGHEGHIGNKTLHKGHGDRKGIMKCKKEKEPSTSSNKISSMTVYQTDGGLQFKRCEDKEQEEDQKELSSYHVESSSLSTNLKAEWFLSTNQWREFIPLRDHGIESLCQKETLNVDNDPTSHDAGTDSNGDTFSVSESLEKMLENHSLFYKITSDINLSDTDITMTDGQSVSNQGEEIEGATNDISTADEVTYRVVRPTDQQIEGCHHSESSTSHGIATDDSGDITTTNEQQDLTSKDRNAPLSANQTLCVSSKPGHDQCIYEEISDNDALPKATEEPTQESQGKIMQSQEWRRPNPESWNHPESEQVHFMHMCGRAETGQENCGTVDMKVEQEGTGELKVANSSVSGERNHAVQNRRSPSKTNSLGLYEEERADRSASFGRGRVTVLRTSL